MLKQGSTEHQSAQISSQRTHGAVAAWSSTTNHMPWQSDCDQLQV